MSSVVKTCFHQLREFRHIRSFIPKSAAIIFANAFIHSRIDYCNSLFYGLPKYSINRLQKYKTKSLVLLLVPLVHHISLQFSNLYIDYQFNTVLTLNCVVLLIVLSLEEPHYLNSLLINRLNLHSLGSSSFNTLTLPFFNKKSYGFRSFAHAAPFLWNRLPNTVRSAPTYLSFQKKPQNIFL